MTNQEFRCECCGRFRPTTEVTPGKFTGTCLACEMIRELEMELHLDHDRIKQHNGSVNPKFIAAVHTALRAIENWEE